MSGPLDATLKPGMPETGAVPGGAAPELGAEVQFQRSTTHHLETGFVVGRQFGSAIIEVVDMNANQVRLHPGQYLATHGMSPAAVPHLPAAAGDKRRMGHSAETRRKIQVSMIAHQTAKRGRANG